MNLKRLRGLPALAVLLVAGCSINVHSDGDLGEHSWDDEERLFLREVREEVRSFTAGSEDGSIVTTAVVYPARGTYYRVMLIASEANEFGQANQITASQLRDPNSTAPVSLHSDHWTITAIPEGGSWRQVEQGEAEAILTFTRH